MDLKISTYRNFVEKRFLILILINKNFFSLYVFFENAAWNQAVNVCPAFENFWKLTFYLGAFFQCYSSGKFKKSPILD